MYDQIFILISQFTITGNILSINYKILSPTVTTEYYSQIQDCDLKIKIVKVQYNCYQNNIKVADLNRITKSEFKILNH